MATNTHDIGDVVRCTGTFTDGDDVAQDPAAVYFKFKAPDGNVTTYEYGVDPEVIKSGTGVYYVDVDIDATGVWYYRFYSTGSGQAAGENNFTIRETNF